MMSDDQQSIPGPIALFGSGETAPNGRRVFESLLKRLPDHPRISILETPAGFELNSALVAGKIADFIDHRLQNFQPQITLIPARKKNTEFSPDDLQILEPMLGSHLIFLGPGSPTYAVNQLSGSLAWDFLRANHWLGSGLALASASTIAVSAFALPVYEIYKVGMDIHWQDGLDLFSAFGLSLSFIPHWNNSDGGKELDTSRCYIGQARFDPMLDMLPANHKIVGIDEHTGMLVDFNNGDCEVIGLGSVTIVGSNQEKSFAAGNQFDIREFGDYQLAPPLDLIQRGMLKKVLRAHNLSDQTRKPPDEIDALAEQRLAARKQGDWDRSDLLREKINQAGWEIQDTQEGYNLLPK